MSTFLDAFFLAGMAASASERGQRAAATLRLRREDRGNALCAANVCVSIV